MSVTLNPYLNFRDEARQALEFYHSVFGGTLNMSTFADFGQSEDAADADKIMHGQIDGDHGVTLMAADTPSHLEYRPAAGFSVSLSGDDDAVLRGYYDRLVDGGTVVEPLVVAPWGDAFGMLIDRFGINWVVNISGSAQA